MNNNKEEEDDEDVFRIVPKPPKWNCERCQYSTNDKRSYDSHLRSRGHLYTEEERKEMRRQKKLISDRNYSNNNKDVVKARRQKYYETNKEELIKKRHEKRQVKINCPCGGIYSQGRRALHSKSKRHQEFEQK
ncbi:MAG TPA: hypothetical protein PLS50_05720 [Candidatus Dojkabacteria bacterium]|nr:hypothetical protein [Candidatus Dojkabacteria bacterium]